MRTPVIIKLTNAFSSFIKMKFCSNLKDTMYFSFLPPPEQSWGRGQEGNGTCLYFPLRVILNFEVNYYSFLILQTIFTTVYVLIRKNYCEFLILTHFSRIWKFA